MRRHGGGAVHLFPASRRLCGDASELRDDLWAGTPGHVCAGRGERVYDLDFNGRGVRYGDIFLRAEREYSAHNFERADTALLARHFEDAERECASLLQGKPLALPAYDQCIKASHLFNLLDARGVISVTERASYIGRVRALAKGCCEAWLAGETADA